MENRQYFTPTQKSFEVIEDFKVLISPKSTTGLPQLLNCGCQKAIHPSTIMTLYALVINFSGQTWETRGSFNLQS